MLNMENINLLEISLEHEFFLQNPQAWFTFFSKEKYMSVYQKKKS